jgi:hypothetical protein
LEASTDIHHAPVLVCAANNNLLTSGKLNIFRPADRLSARASADERQKKSK